MDEPVKSVVDPGPAPELRWLPCDRLTVDHTYQRTLSEKRSQKVIERIAANFKWSAFQAILATPSGDEYRILDGQHRVEAARRVGIAEVPAVVVTAESVAEQAAAFVSANLDRVTVNPYALYHARVAAGEEHALDMARACRSAGIVIPRYPVQLSNLKAGQTLALGTIGGIVKQLGVPAAAATFRAISDAWGEKPVWLRAPLFRAIAEIVAERAIPERNELYGEITTYLRRAMPTALFQRANMMRHERGMSEWKAMRSVIENDLERQRASRAA